MSRRLIIVEALNFELEKTGDILDQKFTQELIYSLMIFGRAWIRQKHYKISVFFTIRCSTSMLIDGRVLKVYWKG